jgi:pyruvate dehydrogenase E2 component (dihydrolipoamide acetyltransferase)
MAVSITIPRLGWNMDEGVFAGWLKQDGDTIRAGDPLFRLEWEKATQDIEAIDQGTLRIPPHGPNVGDPLAVGSVIGYLLGPAETELPASGLQAPPRQVPSATGAPTTMTTNPANVSHRARSRRGEPRISPLARRLARQLGIDWPSVEGTGCTGRIRKADILAAAGAHATPNKPAAPLSQPGTDPKAGRLITLSSMRRTMVARLLESRRATLPVTLTTTADATNLVNLRRQFKATSPQEQGVPAHTDFLVKLTAFALGDHPMLSARLRDGHIEIPAHVHIGIAVDTEAGLLVPVIRHATTLSLGQITACSRDLIGRAREGRLLASEMQEGTFTISNLGAFGIESFTPLINPPECAVLGVGRIQRQPVARGGKIVVRERICLSLSFDHRIVDGAPAARFLQSLVQLVENPGPRLIP